MVVHLSTTESLVQFSTPSYCNTKNLQERFHTTLDRRESADFIVFTQTMPQYKYDKPKSSHAKRQGSCKAQIHAAAGSALPGKCCCPQVQDKITRILLWTSGSRIQICGRAWLLCQKDVQLERPKAASAEEIPNYKRPEQTKILKIVLNWKTNLKPFSMFHTQIMRIIWFYELEIFS